MTPDAPEAAHAGQHDAQDTPLWTPDAQRIRNAQLTRYVDWLQRTHALHLADYDALWRWSVDEPGRFWDSIWQYFDVAGARGEGPALADARMPGARWFPDATLNYAAQVFRQASTARPAIIAGDESGRIEEISWAELERRVGALTQALRRHGVGRGDRVAAVLPNTPDAIVAFLACASLGAIWSLCSPDMGATSVLDRFRQIAPKVLIACDGYRYGGKIHDRRATIAELHAALTSVEVFIRVPFAPLNEAGASADAHSDAVPSSPDATSHSRNASTSALDWHVLTAGDAAPSIEPLPFDHPLWIVYSSGTTGLPKPIVHGHGGIVLELLKMMALHNDIGPEDRFHWYSSTGWIMWNCQVSGLLIGATVCVYDGNPGWPDLNVLWNFAEAAGVTFIGAGAAFHANCMKAGIEPRAGGRLARLRSIGSTGSPLSVECYQWLQHQLGPDVWISPISGGTDLASAFVGGNCTLPVFAGQMQCRCLGAAVEAWDEAGHALIGRVGELVCTVPMPSMPLYFWGDEDGRRYRDSYFDTYPGVWRHGDWIEITERGTAIIYGRSDATINRHGIRMGTSELYAAVEALPQIVDSLVVDLEYLGRPSYMPLFVVLAPDARLDAALERRIIEAIRKALTPRHVPDEIFAVPAVPRTLSGKKLEVPIKRLLLNEPLAKVVNPGAVANPDSLAWYESFAASLQDRLERRRP